VSNANARDDLPTFDGDGLWQPPVTFRECLEDTERLAAQLVNAMGGQLVVSVAEVDFLARRVHQLARVARQSLPPGVC